MVHIAIKTLQIGKTVGEITIKDIALALKQTENNIQKRSLVEGWPFEERPCVGRGGKKKVFNLEDLPENIKLALSRQYLADKTDSFIDQNLYNLDTLSKTGIDQRQNEVALSRADIVCHFLEAKENGKKNGISKVEAGKEFIRYYNTGIPYPRLFNIIGKTSYGTVERWKKTFAKTCFKDYTVLADKYGNRKGASKVTNNEINYLLKFARHENQLLLSEIVRLTKKTLRKKDLDSPSSETTLRNWLKNWKAQHYDSWVLHREGEKALNDKVLPYIERDITALEVGDVLVADGHKLNYQIENPFTGKPCRMTWIVFYDWASCVPVGWSICPTENTEGIAAAFRNAVINLGKFPKVVYLDNGRAFKSKVFNDADIDFEEAGYYGLFARLGTAVVFAWPYHGQSKLVERFFGTFSEAERLIPSYIGTSIAKQPARLHRNEKIHKRMHNKKYGDWVPTIDQANQMITAWVFDYEKRPHKGLKGRYPGDIFKAGKGPGINEDHLTFLMMAMENKPVRRNGVHLFGNNYYSEELYGYRKPVLVRYDLLDKSKVYIYDKSGKELICIANAVKSVHPMARLLGKPEDEEQLKKAIKNKLSLKKKTEKDAREWIESTPDLVPIPERTDTPKVISTNNKKKFIPLSKAEAEEIERKASSIKVSEINPKPKKSEYTTDCERYENYMERECKGEELALDEMSFMRFYETTNEYSGYKERFDMLWEFYSMSPNKEVGINE